MNTFRKCSLEYLRASEMAQLPKPDNLSLILKSHMTERTDSSNLPIDSYKCVMAYLPINKLNVIILSTNYLRFFSSFPKFGKCQF